MTPGRLSIVESVYHQLANSQPVEASTRFSHQLETDEQPYVRVGRIDEGWKLLDAGWLTECSVLVLKNTSADSRQTIPTKAEAKIDAAKIIQLRFVGDRGAFTIAPGESFRGCPGDLALEIRGLSGEAKYVLYIFPK